MFRCSAVVENYGLNFKGLGKVAGHFTMAVCGPHSEAATMCVNDGA